MSDSLQYQLRIYLPDELVQVARGDPGNPELGPLPEIFAKHHATMLCQFDAFAAYVAEAEKQGVEHYLLYAWTRATIDDPVKKGKAPQILCAPCERQGSVRQRGGRRL